ncbi:hypothetical protein OO25_19335 (plasmid) [Phaeobacter sp. S60]|nr:hypothetical protein OO25_19335 [Phaeobacter sp. S60]
MTLSLKDIDGRGGKPLRPSCFEDPLYGVVEVVVQLRHLVTLSLYAMGCGLYWPRKNAPEKGKSA